MANEIVTAFNLAYPNGPIGNPTQPDKATIRGLGQVIQDYSDDALKRLSRGLSGSSRIVSRMASGEQVVIVCYGDSTTDGQGTTSWTANPTDGGDAVGNSNHNLTAPNSWPVKLQAILRAMYSNNSIFVYNAGYAGKRTADGWAVANYEAAVINNTYYGTPDLVINAFGLNDLLPYTYEQIEEQNSLLIDLQAKYGSAVVYLTCDPAPSYASTRDNRDTTRRIDAIKKSVCDQKGIEVFDVGSALTDWLENNNDGLLWNDLQTDFLHGGDTWHAFKAAYVAMRLFPDSVIVGRGKAAQVSPFSSRSGSGHTSTEFSPNSNMTNRFGGNWYYDGMSVAAGTKAIDIWVWNENPDATAIYRGIDGETNVAFSGGMTGGSTVSIYPQIAGSTITAKPGGIGFGRKGGGFRMADVPAVIGKVPWGLSRITYEVGGAQAGISQTGLLGWVGIYPRKTGACNALKVSGNFGLQSSSGSGSMISLVKEATDGSNLWGVAGASSATILARVSLPVGMGLIFGYNSAYDDADNVYGDASFSFLYRQNSTSLQLYSGRGEAGNTSVAFATAIASGTIASQTEYDFRIVVSRSGDNQTVAVYIGLDSTSPVINQTIAYNASDYVVFGGVAGGIFANRTAITGTAFAEIKSLVIL